jgi:hypothetical protein
MTQMRLAKLATSFHEQASPKAADQQILEFGVVCVASPTSAMSGHGIGKATFALERP